MKKIIIIILIAIVLLIVALIAISYYQAHNFYSILDYEAQNVAKNLDTIYGGNCSGWPALKSKIEEGLSAKKLSCSNPITIEILMANSTYNSKYDPKNICSRIKEVETKETGIIQRTQDFCDKK